MTAFVWTMVVLFAIAVLTGAYWVASAKQPKPLTQGDRAVLLVVHIAFLIWALRVLGAL